MAFFWRDQEVFTLFCVLVGLLIVVDFNALFYPSKDDTLKETPAPRRPFSQIVLMAQQMCSSGPSLGRAVQEASVSTSSSWSRSGPWGEARPGIFKFVVVRGGGGVRI